MNDPYSITNLVAPRISYTRSYPSAHGLTQTLLDSNQLSLTRCWLRGRWAPLCWRVKWLVADMACQLCMMSQWLCHDDVILIRVSHVGQVVWYSGRVSPSGRRRHVGCVCSRWQTLRWRVRPFSTFKFYVVFTSVLVSSFFSQCYIQNTIVRTFIFEQKSNTTLNHVLWYQL
jgi:hypothetical protein